MKKFQKLLSLVLTAVMVLGLVAPASATSLTSAKPSSLLSKFAGETLATMDKSELQDAANNPERKYTAGEVVRVSIVLEKPSTIEMGYATMGIADNAQAMSYRDSLRVEQEKLETAISRQALDGEKLDVQWNLTLAANIISANVKYGTIEAIKGVAGVKDVVVETQYLPDVVEKGGLDPNMATSGKMIGSPDAYLAGYTGAGSRIAVIDTGTDTDHQSFTAGGYEYSLKKLAEAAKMDYKDYVASLNLLNAAEIARKLDKLNIAQDMVTPAELYRTSKLAFGYNYVDHDLDITHDKDSAGEHGSHVAGIATANAYIPDGDGYVAAMDSVLVQGVAPDAQLLTMKVFGKNGGAYPSDYMAAIEDAIVLGADSINLSLGSGSAGLATDSEFQAVLDMLAETDTVVVISAGNSGSWADETTNGMLYNDGANLDMVGSPGSFTNSLAVASVDNAGSTTQTLKVGEKKFGFSETSGYGNAPIGTLDPDGTGTEYDFVYFDHTGTDADLNNLFEPYADVVKDKVVFCYRGASSFYTKMDAAAAVGAKACIVVNNTTGVINMNLTGATSNIPCVSILFADGEAVKADAATTAVTAEDGTVLYYTGKITVNGKYEAMMDGKDYYTMSTFSSWGVPGSLELKPEITAPGGSIYSVNGLDTSGKGYELMSGTSMAAPQVTGMVALVAQYIRETKLDEKTSVSPRVLAQSLLMSTAVPMDEYWGIDEETEERVFGIYSVLKQGAGLAHVGKAIAAESYIMVDGQPDGKVKVELGDDADRTGAYKTGFTVTNISKTDMTYTLTADMFTQDVFEYGGEMFLDYWTRPMGCDVTFTVDGKAVTEVTVPVGGAVKVDVTMTLTAEEVAQLKEDSPNGAYVEGFLYATPKTTVEGAEGVTHSIPVLGYYGSWSEPSMFDGANRLDYLFDQLEREPYIPQNYNTNYLTAHSVEYNDSYVMGDNPLAWDEELIRDRGSFNSENGDTLDKLYFTAIRNFGAAKYVIYNTDTKEVYAEKELGAGYGAYYYANGGYWSNTRASVTLGWDGSDANGKPLPDGTRVSVTLILAPEYYRNADGSYRWDELKDGTKFTTDFTIDNVAPEILGVAVDTDAGTITVTAKDNRYISDIALMDQWGDYPNENTPNQTKKGEVVEYTFSMEYLETDYLSVVVTDYALNESTYKIDLTGADPGPIKDIQMSPATAELLVGETFTPMIFVEPWIYTDTVVWTSSDETVATVDADGVVTAVGKGTATIRATSSGDEKIYAACEVTVSTCDFDVKGVLQDVDGSPMSYEWNLAKDTTWSKVADLPKGSDMVSATDTGDGIWIMNSDFVTYQVDFATGEKIKDGGACTVPYDDMAYSTVYINRDTVTGEVYPIVNGVYWSYLFPLKDPAALDARGYNLASWFGMFTGASSWVGITSVGYDGEGELLLAMDDMGYLWLLRVNPDGLSLLNLFDVYDLPTDFPGNEDFMFCSLYLTEDEVPFVSYHNGDTNEIYMLKGEVDEEGYLSYTAKKVGDVGDGVWPAMITSVDPVTPVELFDDCNPDAWYSEYVNYVVDNGLMKGVSKTEFAPDQPMTRGMVATVLYRFATDGGKYEPENDITFSDVDMARWYADGVAWAVDKGIMNGYTDGTFKPNEPISREQFATVLFRFAKAEKPENLEALDKFPDGGDVHAWAQDAMAWAVDAGLFQGFTDGLLHPVDGATRAQGAKLLTIFIENVYEEPAPETPENP